MRIMVTGGAGYIGSHAVEALLRHGHDVIVLDNLSKGHRGAVPGNVPFYVVDLMESSKIESILNDHRIEAVMHFAAFIAVGESVQQPAVYYTNNTAGALSLLSAMASAQVNRFIFSSTAATYGMPEEVPIAEDSPQQPINPYGWSKWMVERILKDIATGKTDFSFTALRYFNVAGASSSGRIGEDHDPETHLIPNVLKVPLGQLPEISIFGTDYPTPDGTCIRDYVHVEDLISAHLLALESLRPGETNFFNVGIGRGYSVGEIITAAQEVVGQKIPTRIAPKRAGDPPQLYACPDKIMHRLGWKPRFTDIREIISTAWQWHKNNPTGYGD